MNSLPDCNDTIDCNDTNDCNDANDYDYTNDCNDRFNTNTSSGMTGDVKINGIVDIDEKMAI